jgi:general secretion pathway protein D
VGADIPVIASQSGYYTPTGEGGIGGTGSIQNYPFQSINYINTGIILKVKPAILSNNNVSLKISQEISEAQTNETSDISSPEILKRKVETTLLVQEGQIAFMGGLIQKKQSEGKSGVPVLSKIPILGNLFKKTSTTQRKTELVLFISAKIIQKTSDMKDIVEGIKNIINQDLYQEEEDEKQK